MSVFVRVGKRNDCRIGWQSDDDEQSIEMTREELGHLKALLNTGDL